MSDDSVDPITQLVTDLAANRLDRFETLQEVADDLIAERTDLTPLVSQLARAVIDDSILLDRLGQALADLRS